MTDRAPAALSRDTADPDPLLGRVIAGRFRVTALIAKGGMGKVYRAEQAPLGRICAIKVLNSGYAAEHDPEFHKRFFLEASVASRLTHPNTVTIFDYGRTEDDVYYMAMEYLEGHTLHRAIRESGHLPEERVVPIARQICRALREAHALGVIHRDLKPANIFLVKHGDEADFVKVLDFGLVKNVAEKEGEDLTQTGMFMGSPKYMSPEQIRGDRVDARTDIYALGIIMYEMLTGKVPFDRPSSVNILMAHVHESPAPMHQVNPLISVSRRLEETVAGCMEKNPDRRFGSMDDVLTSLKRAGDAAAMPTISGLEATERVPVSGSDPGRELRLEASRRDSTAPAASVRDASNAGAPQSLRSTQSTAKALWIAAGTGTLVLAGIVGYIGLRPVSPTSFPVPAAAPTLAAASGTSTAVLAPTASAPATGPISIKLRVTTEPEGASVKENGVEVCSSTPCDILYEGDDADPSREHKLALSRLGYRTEIRSVTAADGRISVKLAPTPRVVLPPPKADTPSVPGYKTDIPY
jgi:serine/threonine protein kinase